ncbi:MAG: Gfo/Idh/MocA family oxidoreductase [Victivallales bacterium]|nr:Gfo/Idh/MocA family oxidoreductase [Victivallales bacterium]
MSSEKIKVGVVGVGALGRHHARLYKDCGNAEVVGIYDLNPEVAKRVAEEFGFKIYKTIKGLAEKCEALSIAVPADLHHKIARPLLEMDKHLLIEKPLAVNIEQAGELVTIAEERNLVLEVGHTERYNPVMSFIDDKLEDVRYIEARRLAPYPPPRPGLHPRGTEVGVVLDLMIHDLELILHMVKSKVAKVEAAGIPVLSKTEDVANARITFKNGCVANVTATRINNPMIRRMKVYQKNSYFSLDYQERTGFVCTKTETGIAREDIPVKDHNALFEEMKNFCNNALSAKQTGRMPHLKVPGRRGLEALRLAIKITDLLHLHNEKYNLPDGENEKLYQQF